jgi:fumarylacetoacetate (FAA) hydrolase family protein
MASRYPNNYSIYGECRRSDCACTDFTPVTGDPVTCLCAHQQNAHHVVARLYQRGVWSDTCNLA